MNFYKSIWQAVVCFGGLFFLFQTAVGQGSWNPVFRPFQSDLVSVYFTSEEKGFIGGDGGVFAFTTDGGRNWTKQALNTNDNVNEIYFRNDDNGYLLVGKRIFMTNDGGKSWRENKVLSPNEFIGLRPEFLSIRFSGKKRGWIVGSVSNQDEEVVDSLVLQTLDGGETWTRASVPSNKMELYHVDFVNDENGWIVGDGGLIIRTQDGGLTWSVQNSGTKVSLFNVDFRDKSDGIIVGSEGTILRTENGGQTWEKITTVATKSLLRVNFNDDKRGWVVGIGGMILRTDDKGKTWVKQNTQFTDSLYGLYTDKRGGWAVGKKGVILKYVK
jgi:photosystem II stability/assembly factor-like uncharacterized protein